MTTFVATFFETLTPLNELDQQHRDKLYPEYLHFIKGDAALRAQYEDFCRRTNWDESMKNAFGKNSEGIYHDAFEYIKSKRAEFEENYKKVRAEHL